MHSIRKFTLIFCLSLYSIFLTSEDTTYHLTLEKRMLDNSWNLPIDLPRSFKNYNENKYSISAQRKNFSIFWCFLEPTFKKMCSQRCFITASVTCVWIEKNHTQRMVGPLSTSQNIARHFIKQLWRFLYIFP